MGSETVAGSPFFIGCQTVPPSPEENVSCRRRRRGSTVRGGMRLNSSCQSVPAEGSAGPGQATSPSLSPGTDKGTRGPGQGSVRPSKRESEWLASVNHAVL